MVSRDIVVPCGIVFLTYVFLGLWNRRRRLPPPPGPGFRELDLKALKTHPWLGLWGWAQKYGPIFSYSVLGKRTVVISSHKIAVDLLEERSSIYSDRPFNWMGGELANRKHNAFQISTTDPNFKIYRRLMHGGLNPRVSRDYLPIQTEELHTFMKELESKPQNFKQSIKRYDGLPSLSRYEAEPSLLTSNACAIILKVAYGYPMGGYEDEFVNIIEEGFAITADLATPGKWFVEFFPWQTFRVDQEADGKYPSFFHELLAYTFKQASGDFIDSFTSKQLLGDTSYIDPSQKEYVVKWCAAALYAGGADTVSRLHTPTFFDCLLYHNHDIDADTTALFTGPDQTVSALTSFFLLMELYPDVQKKAQQEIDRVTGGNRLPTLDDYDALPYMRDLVKEVIRWAPVAPIGLPHATTQDDVYNGYFIPKGSKVISNIWAITHDEEIYPNPSVFDPERYSGENPQPDAFKYVFGFGRRSCPGAHLAEQSLFLNMTNILAVFSISKPKNPDGTEVEPPIVWSTGITTHLETFPCDIKVRPGSQHLLASIH
ncbi:hypothetical protein MD484_g4790, partial [Candolleomyces efflorescens]